jgi:hypothetical protein
MKIDGLNEISRETKEREMNDIAIGSPDYVTFELIKNLKIDILA